MGITRTWTPLRLEEMEKNINGLKQARAEGIEIKELTSANAYSFEPITGSPMHGTCQPYLTVETAEEGCKLRENGVTLPILVREYPKPNSVTAFVKMMHRNFLALSIDNLEDFRAVSSRVIPIFGGILSVHIKVEIGEGTEGKLSFAGGDAPFDDILLLKSTLGIYCEGIYTVLKKDAPEDEKRSKVKELNALADRLGEITGKPIPIRHVFCE